MKSTKKTVWVLKIITAVMIMLAIPGTGASAECLRTSKEVRDPCVILVDDTYYMYGTGLAWPGYGCSTSTDLVNWSENKPVFLPSENFDGDGDFWAPECHYYNGSYYLFASWHSKVTGYRGVGIFRSASPAGPFELISDGHITPKTHDAIDGTLYIDKNGEPWMMYVNEWTSNADGIGDMAIAKMSADLTHFVTEPKIIFRAKDAAWSESGVTDGPWLYRTSNGRLIMLWSSFTDKGYVVGIAYSSNGEITGKWRQQRTLLYESGMGGSKEDGGHGMLFTDKNGQLTLSIHSPNGSREDCHTTAIFLPVTDIGDTLVLKDGTSGIRILALKLRYALADVFEPLIDKLAAFFRIGTVC